jgi:hypothetical protein
MFDVAFKRSDSHSLLENRKTKPNEMDFVILTFNRQFTNQAITHNSRFLKPLEEKIFCFLKRIRSRFRKLITIFCGKRLGHRQFPDLCFVSFDRKIEAIPNEFRPKIRGLGV